MSCGDKYVPFYAIKQDSLLCGLNACCNALNIDISVESINEVVCQLNSNCNCVREGSNFGMEDIGQLHIKTL